MRLFYDNNKSILFRRILAAFLVFLFIAVSAVTFVFFAASNTLLNPDFYKGSVKNDIHDFLVNTISNSLIENDVIIAENFTETDIKREIKEVFTLDVFEKLDLPGAIRTIKDNPERPYTLSLTVLRQSMLTLAHNLSFRLFENISRCEGGEVPEVNVKGLPTCVPVESEYDDVLRPFSTQFENAIFITIPDQIDINLSSTDANGDIFLAEVLSEMAAIKYGLYTTLIVLIVLIALLILRPFSLIMMFEGLAFMISGFCGYVLSLMIGYIPKISTINFGEVTKSGDIEALIMKLLYFLSAEVQKVALLFLAFGAVLILVKIYLKRR